MRKENGRYILDRDQEGVILPTKRNSKILNEWGKEVMAKEGIDGMDKELLMLLGVFIFDPRKEGVFFDTPEMAREAAKRMRLT